MICRAQHCLRGLLQRTPLVHSTTLSDHLGAQVYLKLEFLQKTGSFKPRGAFNKMLTLSAEEHRRGVVAVSGGNHAQGVAYAARELGISAVIAMPAFTPRNYLDATPNRDHADNGSMRIDRHVILSRPRDQVLLLAPNHDYAIIPP